jgi:hypothetical protein
MHYLLNVCGIATAVITLAAAAPSADAQDNTFTLTCQNIGGGAPEPLGDRPDHSISVSDYTCRFDSGPLKGGVSTANAIWEFDGPNAVLVSGNGVVRAPGATVVYQEASGKLALTMTDGKVTGFAASGQGSMRMATGSAASLAGKSYTFASKPTGQGQFAVEITVQ